MQFIYIGLSLGAIAWIRAGTVIRPGATRGDRLSIELAFAALIASLTAIALC